MRAISVMLLLMPLGACVEPAPAGPNLTESCGAETLQGLVGQPESVVAAMTFTQDVRVIRPGTAVTMDYRPDRLNIVIDAQGNVSSVNCS
ncbi:MAG TPA: I78 family peptidase inhibitor [Paracoccaceae bacterium]|nr:I78 family peptidase inhibitor [Paracoccaceae bacterium]